MRRLFSISQLSATRRLEETLPPPLPTKGPGVEADKMTPLPPNRPAESSDPGLASPTLAAPTRTAWGVGVCEQRCLPLSARLHPSSSSAAMVALTLVIGWFCRALSSPVTFTQWCFGCSSGKRVSVFVLFCYYPD